MRGGLSDPWSKVAGQRSLCQVTLENERRDELRKARGSGRGRERGREREGGRQRNECVCVHTMTERERVFRGRVVPVT